MIISQDVLNRISLSVIENLKSSGIDLYAGSASELTNGLSMLLIEQCDIKISEKVSFDDLGPMQKNKWVKLAEGLADTDPKTMFEERNGILPQELTREEMDKIDLISKESAVNFIFDIKESERNEAYADVPACYIIDAIEETSSLDISGAIDSAHPDNGYGQKESIQSYYSFLTDDNVLEMIVDVEASICGALEKYARAKKGGF